MVKISELVESEGPPVTIAKQENDKSFRKDSGLESNESIGETEGVKTSASLSSGTHKIGLVFVENEFTNGRFRLWVQ